MDATTLSTILMLVAFWLVVAAIAAYVARLRGRSPADWALLTFFLTPLAFIVLLLLPDLKAEDERKAQEKVCPRCAERVQRLAKVCRYCGHEFETVHQWG